MAQYTYQGLTRKHDLPHAEAAAAFELSDRDPEQRATDQANMLSRLVGVLADKGLLLPSEVVKVLGHNWSSNA